MLRNLFTQIATPLYNLTSIQEVRNPRGKKESLCLDVGTAGKVYKGATS